MHTVFVLFVSRFKLTMSKAPAERQELKKKKVLQVAVMLYFSQMTMQITYLNLYRFKKPMSLIILLSTDIYKLP